MEQQFWFEKGDVFRIEKEMTLSFRISSMFKSPYTFDKTKREFINITVGEVLKPRVPISREDLIEKIFWNLVELTLLDGRISGSNGELYTPNGNITSQKISAFVDTLGLDFDPPEFDTSVFVGEYIVDGQSGSAYCAPTSKLPTTVWNICHKLDDPSIIVDLRQDRNFSTQYPNCKVIRHEP